jgi:hypothetical protein
LFTDVLSKALMATPEPSRNPFLSPDQLTLADLTDRIAADESLLPGRRKDILSALNTFSRVVGKPLTALAANARFLRGVFTTATPTAAGITKERWANIRSLVLAALTSEGLASVPGRYTAPLSQAWQTLWDRLPPGKGLRDQMSRLFHFCSANGIAPTEITDAVIDGYAKALIEESFVKHPHELHRLAVKGWNKAAAMIAEWPQVALAPPASLRRDFSLPWADFPASLVEAFEAHLHRGTKNVDLLDDDWTRPLRPESITTRRKQFRRYLSALTLAGRSPETLTSLAAVVDLATIKTGLRVLLERNDNKATKDVFDVA